MGNQEYNARPEVRERKRKYSREYDARPGNRERKREYNRAYGARPEVRERRRRLTGEALQRSNEARNARLALMASDAGVASGVARARAVPPPPARPPACMTWAEFDGWRAHNRHVARGSQAPSPCFDCPLGFAAEMRAIGQCDGVPGGVPEDDEEEAQPSSPARRRSWAEAGRRYRARRAAA